MKTARVDAKGPHITRGNVFEAIGFNRSEALELKVKSEIYMELLKHIRQQRLTQAELGLLLGIHQPDVSHLMTGRASKFSVGKLIQFAGKLNLEAQVTFKRARPKSEAGTTAKTAGLGSERVVA